MKKQLLMIVIVTYIAAIASANASATTVPFSEDFPTDNANWKDTNYADLTHVASGGPDGSSYVNASFSFEFSSEDDATVLFRGHDEFNFSGNNFVGNWNADGVATLTAQFRHNAPVPLSFFARTSSPAGFPGAVAVQFGVALPNVWTEVVFDVTPSSPQIVTYEGSDWASVFSNIGHVQLGVSVPASLEGDAGTYSFDLDQVAIALPEPSTLMLGSLGMLFLFSRQRKR